MDNKPQTAEQEDVKPLGQILVESGLVDEAQLERALRIQGKLKKPKRLGRVLIEMGVVTEADLYATLEKHARKVRLGDILIEHEFLTPEALDQALAVQKQSPHLKLGEILVQERLISASRLCDALALFNGRPRLRPEIRDISSDLLTRVSLNFLEQNKVLPYRIENKRLTVAIGETHNPTALESIANIFELPIDLGYSTDQEIITVVRYLREKPSTSDYRSLLAKGTDNDIPFLVDKWIAEAAKHNASDLHIEPMDTHTRIRLRIDGKMVIVGTLPKSQHAAFVSRIKVLSNCDLAEHRNHQDGKAKVSFNNQPIDLRVAIYVTVNGEAVTLRLLNPVSTTTGLDELGFLPKTLDRFLDEAVLASSGIILVTGPTGSGKTTALYATLQYQISPEIKVVTVEDPVEFMIPEMQQCSVDEKAGRTFANTLRNMVRQDPDIIVLGEIRDLESAEIAIQAAMTGHKVYATLHTEDAVGALFRLGQMGVEPYLVASNVQAILAQRLVRRICVHCRKPYIPNPRIMRKLGVAPTILKTKDFLKGTGCEHCFDLGYKGRLAIHELLLTEERIRDALMRQASTYQIRELALKHAGLVTMAEDGLYKAFMDLTTLEEVIDQCPVLTTPRALNQISRLVE
ncbi:MAG: Flp pilus assembly complex ATPase component TadA [Acidobacteria bacterium]|nr:Flp pilus assembly complex ATPase component TadA [Acidobacteriota bacterium]